MNTIATVGSIITDLMVSTPRVPNVGENISADNFKMGPGGKGANAAAAVARLNARSILVGHVGEDNFGKRELEVLRDNGVETDAISIDPEVSTGVALIMVDAQGENSILVVNGANNRIKASDVEVALARYWNALNALIVNFEVPEEVVAATVDAADKHRISVVVDAGPPRSYSSDTWAKATVISPNELEASTLVGYSVDNDEMAIKAARDILNEGPRAVVLKRGKAGALLVTNKEVTKVPSFSVNTVDPTGAGDAFTAALTVALAEGQSLPQAVSFANAAGAIAVSRLGTLLAMPRRAEVEALLNREKSKL